jgi:predicted nucleic acid-binding protein
MRAALDTNILVYAEGAGDSLRVSASRELLDSALAADLVIPVQCLGELFRVLTGKAGRSREQAQISVLSWMDAFEIGDTTADAWRGAMDLCVAHQLSNWDALVLNVAAASGARLLLTEDMHSGLCWRGVLVVNPFSAQPDPLLKQLLM